MSYISEHGIKAVCFDIDGTLYPKSQTNRILVKTALADLPFALRYLMMRRKMREEDGFSDFPLSSADDFKRRELAIMYGERKDLDWFLEKERSVFHAKWEEEFLSVRMFPGMADFLRDLKKIVPVAFLTDFPVGTKLKAMGIEDVPQFVICSENIGHLKPSRLPFRLLSERLSLNAEEILYVGDSEKKDVLGARNAGMKSLLITKDARKAKKSAADLVVSSYAEMREKLL